MTTVHSTQTPAYPVRVEAALDRSLSRWLWLVKWLLAIPHYVMLAFLWIVFALFSVAAFFAILFTGRYPRALFDFNVGVMRWTWRVAYYAYGALGTDRYPPFSLNDVPDYPAHLEVPYPEHLSRGLVLVKWWLLALPHYVIVSFFVGGGAWFALRLGEDLSWMGGGLIGILVLIAGISLLFRGEYPLTIFDIVLGLNRWALRVAAYASLMTDAYPPFRLDQGGHDPGTFVAVQTPSPVAADPGHETSPGAFTPQPPAGPLNTWTAGRIVAVVIGCVMIVGSLGLVAGGLTSLAADRLMREDGYVTSPERTFSTPTLALTTPDAELTNLGWPATWLLQDAVGDIRVRVTPTDDTEPIFVGIADASDVSKFLSGASYAVVDDPAGGPLTYTVHRGGRQLVQPAGGQMWVAQEHGLGPQSLVWAPEEGRWAIVVMNAAATAGVSVTADFGATAPALTAIAIGLLVAGSLILLGGVLLVVATVRRVKNQRRVAPPPVTRTTPEVHGEGPSGGAV